MSDVFISYATEDRDRAGQLAQALKQRGWSVWWDRAIPPGRQYDEVIEEALAVARCVVVLWSPASVASRWVKIEAGEAFNRQALIPALLDETVKIPLEFRRVQAANLAHWRGEPGAPAFVQLCAAIQALVAPATAAGARAGPPPGPEPAPPPRAAEAPAAAAPRPESPPATPPPSAHRPAAAPHRASGWSPARTTWQQRLRSAKSWDAPKGVWLVLLLMAAGLWGWLEQGGPRPWPVSPDPVNESLGPAQERESMRAEPGAVLAADEAAAASDISPLDLKLMWRDDVLLYRGRLRWDGVSGRAELVVDVTDERTSRFLLSNVPLQAAVQALPNRQWRFDTAVSVAGDSQTPTPHQHPVALFLERRPGGDWRFLRNCKSPAECWVDGE